ncbi:MAG: hypothetical protein JWR69_955 [Pedosphaera sp.]|nr:hypothetical protein [Pedosphaera sp.]
MCCVDKTCGAGWRAVSCPRDDALASADPPALDKPNKNDDDRNDKEDVDEASHGVRRDQPQQPEEDENNCDGFEHNIIGLRVVALFFFLCDPFCASPAIMALM